jgi:DNA-binding winged helix-turn-helix (wHTH) protein
MISMTWPQYRRCECMIEGFVVRLTRREADALSTLLMRLPGVVSLSDLIGSIFPDPDDEPDNAKAITQNVLANLAAKIGRFRIRNHPRCGYRLLQRPEQRLAA